MSSNAQKRTRSQRVATIDARPRGWLPRLHKMRRSSAWPRLLVCLLGVLLIWLSMSPWYPPFDYRVGYTPPRDILATVRFTAVDEDATRSAQIVAERDVPFIFEHNAEPIDRVVQELADVLKQIPTYQDPPDFWDNFLPLPESGSDMNPQERIQRFQQFRELLSRPGTVASVLETVDHALAPYKAHGFLLPEQLQQPPFTNHRGYRQDAITVYPRGIDPLEEREKWQTVPISQTLLGNGTKLSERLNEQATMVNTADYLFYWLMRRLPTIQPPLSYNAGLTQAVQQEAAEKVPPVLIEYAVGTPLAAHGEPLDDAAIERLRQEHKAVLATQSDLEQWLRAFALFGIVLALFALCGYYVYLQEPLLWRSLRSLTLVVAMAVGTVVSAYWLSVDQWRAELVPVMLFGLVMGIVYRQEVALLLTLGLCVLVVYATGQTLGNCLVLMAVVSTGIFMVRRIRSRRKLIWVGLCCSLVAFSLTMVVGILDGQPLTWLFMEGVRDAFWALVTSFLISGLLPFLEAPFGVVTDLSLLELGDVAHPLLQELVRRAPGTYNHSINVASIADAAAESIGANGLLVRVGAYFHDIGKMLKPDYFVENQDQVNRHDTLVPAMSTLIIIAHVKDGADLAKQYNLPPRIIDFIEQHHGTTLVQYFYDRANRQQQMNPDSGKVDESAFRYPGPKPQSKEAGVLMLADAVESASRTLAEPTATRIRNLVHSIVTARLMDGQFDESGLNLNELRTIEESLVKSLIAVYHGRVKYSEPKPSEAKPGETGKEDTSLNLQTTSKAVSDRAAG